MKVKLKKWMEKMTRAVKPATCTAVSFPFTPTCNGLLIGLIRAGAQGRCYVTLTNAIPNIIDAYQVAGGYCVGAVFVTKNNKVEQSGSSNIASTTYYFIPLVGGVLRSPVISRLTAIFTSLLSGGDVNETEAERIVGKGIDPHCRQYLKDRFDCHRIKNLVKHNDSSRWKCNCDNKYRKERIQTNCTCRFFDIPRFNSAARDLVAWKQSRLYSQKSYGCFGFETNGCFCDLHQVVAISGRWAA